MGISRDFYYVFLVRSDTDFDSHECDNCGTDGEYHAIEITIDDVNYGEFTECQGCGCLYLRNEEVSKPLPPHWKLRD